MVESRPQTPSKECLRVGSGERGQIYLYHSISMGICRWTHRYVTVYEKTRHMGFSMKIEFDAYLISSTIELTRVQVSDRSRASLWSYSAFFAIAPHPQQSRNYGLKALLCTRMAFPYTTRIPEVN